MSNERIMNEGAMFALFCWWALLLCLYLLLVDGLWSSRFTNLLFCVNTKKLVVIIEELMRIDEDWLGAWKNPRPSEWEVLILGKWSTWKFDEHNGRQFITYIYLLGMTHTYPVQVPKIWLLWLFLGCSMGFYVHNAYCISSLN
jgi:hypothetical protein